MKKIICFVVEQGNHPSLAPISQAVAQGFRDIGKDVYAVELHNEEQLQQAYDYMLQGKADFCVGLNAFVDKLANVNKEPIFENLDVPYVSIMLDAPYNLATGAIDFPCKKHLLCMLDRSHLALTDRIYPKKKFMGTMFLPLAGMSGGNEDEIFSRERPLDVIYSAGIYNSGNPGRIWHDNATDKYIRKIIDDVAEYLIVKPVSVAEGFHHVLKNRGIYDEEVFYKMLPNFFGVFIYVKAIRRVKALEMLAKNDVVVDVYGGGWDSVPLVHGHWGKNIRLHGPTTYQESLDLLASAKIVYQDQAEFNNGAHDRVFSGMLSGAAVVSEYSSYLAEEFIDGQDIFLYDWENGFNQISVIHELLTNESKRLSATINAYGKVNNKHRWVNRAESICEAVSLFR